MRNTGNRNAINGKKGDHTAADVNESAERLQMRYLCIHHVPGNQGHQIIFKTRLLRLSARKHGNRFSPFRNKTKHLKGNRFTHTGIEESEYLSALVKDEALLGDDKSVQLDGELFKSVVPILQKHGIAPAAANEMANALAKAQIEQAKTAMQARMDYFEKMKQESLRTYTQRGFEKINAGIDKWFKPGGTMNQVIRNSELGADPEFLALMHHLGEMAAEDDGAGADAGGGADAGDPNSISGLASIW